MINLRHHGQLALATEGVLESEGPAKDILAIVTARKLEMTYHHHPPHQHERDEKISSHRERTDHKDHQARGNQGQSPQWLLLRAILLLVFQVLELDLPGKGVLC